MTQHVHAKFNEKLDIFSFSSDHAKFSQKLVTFSLGHLALFTATQVFPCDLLPATLCDDGGNLCALSEVERCQKYIDQLQQQLGEDHNLELIKLIQQSLHNSPRIRPTSDDIVCIVEPLACYIHHKPGMFSDIQSQRRLCIGAYPQPALSSNL